MRFNYSPLGHKVHNGVRFKLLLKFDNGKFVIKINIRLKNQDYGHLCNDLTAKRYVMLKQNYLTYGVANTSSYTDIPCLQSPTWKQIFITHFQD